MTNRDRILVLAAMAEELAAFPEIPGIKTRVCGVGKVNAALAVAQAHFESFSAILIVGTAGAVDPNLEVGDVVIAKDTLHHDVDVTPLGFEPAQIPFNESWVWETQFQLRALAEVVCNDLGCEPNVGRIITGDRFVADRTDVKRLRSTFKASCLEMETAGIAQACERFGIPWLGIRVISDKADGSAHVDFPSFLPRASDKLARIVQRIVSEWFELQPVEVNPQSFSVRFPGCIEEVPLPDPFDFQGCLEEAPILDLTDK